MIHTLLILFFLALIPSSISAMQNRPVPLEEVYADADAVALVRIDYIGEEVLVQDFPCGRPYHAEIIERFKGLKVGAADIEFTCLGGLEKGMKYLLFLTKAGSAHDFDPVPIQFLRSEKRYSSDKEFKKVMQIADDCRSLLPRNRVMIAGTAVYAVAWTRVQGLLEESVRPLFSSMSFPAELKPASGASINEESVRYDRLKVYLEDLGKETE